MQDSEFFKFVEIMLYLGGLAFWLLCIVIVWVFITDFIHSRNDKKNDSSAGK